MGGCGGGVGIILDPMPRRASPSSAPHGAPNLMGEAHPPSICRSLKGLVLKQSIESLAGPGRDMGFTLIKCSDLFTQSQRCHRGHAVWGGLFLLFLLLYLQLLE